MDTIIKHMVEISGHRDHTLLDISILSAIQELAGATQARVLGIYTQNGEMLIQPRAWIRDGAITTLEDGQASEPPEELLVSYPALAKCVKQHDLHAQEQAATGEYRLWLPVWVSDKITSCIEVSNPVAYSPQTLDVLNGILSVYRNFQSLLDYSERDSLTGLLNRKTFDSHFAKMQAVVARQACLPTDEIERRRAEDHAEADKEHWLAVVDIDHFKHVNDQFGHLYGDEVLILVANLMQSSFRAIDRIFRFGGEEFVILINGTSLEDVAKALNRFRVQVQNHIFPQVGHITVSVGFTRIEPFESPVSVVGHADQALYYAKSNGRNRVCHYEALVGSGLLQAGSVANDTAEFF